MKNFISKLTFKKANIITITIALVLSVLAVVFFFFYYSTVFFEKLGLSIFVATGIAFFVYLTMYIIIGVAIFDLSEKEQKKQQ